MVLKVIGAGFKRTGAGLARLAFERPRFDGITTCQKSWDIHKKSRNWLNASLKKQTGMSKI
jgi:hypothetical protein